MKSSGVSPLLEMFINLRAETSVTNLLAIIKSFSLRPTFCRTTCFKLGKVLTFSDSTYIKFDFEKGWPEVMGSLMISF